MGRFLIVLVFVYGILMLGKDELIPALLHFFLPISDFRSMLYEILILTIGVGSLFFSFLLGSYARGYQRFGRGFLLFFLLLCAALFFFAKLYAPSSLFTVLLKEWSDLVAEPYRILTFSYGHSEWIGLFLLLFFFWLGYEEKYGEERRTEKWHKLFTSARE